MCLVCFVNPHRSGWAFPWGLRVQLAEVLLQGLFDSANSGYVAQHERLLAGIARQLWPLLGISAPVADALWAWVHFREVGFESVSYDGGDTYHS